MSPYECVCVRVFVFVFVCLYDFVSRSSFVMDFGNGLFTAFHPLLSSVVCVLVLSMDQTVASDVFMMLVHVSMERS